MHEKKRNYSLKSYLRDKAGAKKFQAILESQCAKMKSFLQTLNTIYYE